MNQSERIMRLKKIIAGEFIYPVYQPIVSLTDGSILGYEALSRITNEEYRMNIEEMFSTAESIHAAWELETLCRSKALDAFSKHKKNDNKLFLNVNPNIIHDEHFMQGFTKERLESIGMSADNLIFEITERVAVSQKELFFESVEHYKNQNYGIAIDDVGAGFSGLNVMVDVKPRYIKLDMHLIRDIDKNETKYYLCKSLTEFCKNVGILIIAEGIETHEELHKIIQLGIDYGQGYFLAIPDITPGKLSPKKIELISKINAHHHTAKIRKSLYPTVEQLCKRGHTFSPYEKASAIYEQLKLDSSITEFAILKDTKATGFMSRTDLNSILGGRYGYSLHSKRTISELPCHDFLQVNYNMTVDQVSKLAMKRSHDRLYDPIVVEKEGSYFGIVTIKDLLDTCTQIEVDAAMHSNPLTGLPGNLMIEKEISSRIFSNRPYCITYYDIDNFKAYNDAYGFENGDLMLSMMADILKKYARNNEFVGHIGGDDFIVIADYEDGRFYCDAVMDAFFTEVQSLYHPDDVEKGYIISKNRNGVTEKFPLASVSIAGITSREKRYTNIDDFSKDAAILKKRSKKHNGNYCSFMQPFLPPLDTRFLIVNNTANQMEC